MKSIYLMGSMRNPSIPHVANVLREAGYDVFDDWYSPGEQADDKWKEYERFRGRTYRQALRGYHAKHAFAFDHYHLRRQQIGVLALPAGKSAHIELGWMVGQGKPVFILFDGEPEPDRFDLMYRFVFTTGGDICCSVEELIEKLGALGEGSHQP